MVSLLSILTAVHSDRVCHDGESCTISSKSDLYRPNSVGGPNGGHVSSHTAVHVSPAQRFLRGALGWPPSSSSSCIERASVTRQCIPAWLASAFPRSPMLLPPQNGSVATDCVAAHPRDLHAQLLSGCVAVLSQRLHRGPP